LTRMQVPLVEQGTIGRTVNSATLSAWSEICSSYIDFEGKGCGAIGRIYLRRLATSILHVVFFTSYTATIIRNV